MLPTKSPAPLLSCLIDEWRNFQPVSHKFPEKHLPHSSGPGLTPVTSNPGAEFWAVPSSSLPCGIFLPLSSLSPHQNFLLSLKHGPSISCFLLTCCPGWVFSAPLGSTLSSRRSHVCLARSKGDLPVLSASCAQEEGDWCPQFPKAID